MRPPVAVRPSHLGLCVSDLGRSLRFYCDGLGFSAAERYELTDAELPGLAAALEVPPPVSVVSQFIRSDALAIELLAFARPGAVGRPGAMRNQLGLTHLAFHVDDLAAATARLVDCGGSVVDATRSSLGAELVFVADPDGARVELMQGPG